MKNNLRVERAILNITQEELSQKVGVSRQTINAIELNKYLPSTLLALKIGRFFNKKVEEIFILEDEDLV
jgi:putative transcriptional regulator